jgi:DNA-binding transcriptional LysR family regulator
MDLLAQMTTFVRVVEAGSLSSAARSLKMSAPAVSRQIAALEASLGHALTLRSTRRTSITTAGDRYYEHCVRILREVEAARLSVAAADVGGLLTLNAPITLGLTRIAPRLPPFLAEHPDVRIDLHVDDKVVDLVADGVDVAIRCDVPVVDSSSVVARKLFTFRRVIVASPEYLKHEREPAAPSDLSRCNAIIHLSAALHTTKSPTVWRLARGGGGGVEVPVVVRGVLRTNAVYAARDAALAGVGIALLPDWLVADDVAAGRLRRVLKDYETPLVRTVAVYRTERRSSPAIKALVAHLVTA